MAERHGACGFSMLEMLVSTAILGAIVVLLAGVMSGTATIWTRTTAKVDQFREARSAFETITTRLSQATLNTYWDYQYDNPTSPNRVPQKYTRRSELRFISGPSAALLGAGGRERPTHAVFFHAPFGETEAVEAGGTEKFAGFENLLCAWGYFLEYSGDDASRPDFLAGSAVPQRYRYRLMELREPAESNRIFSFTSGLNPAQQNYTGRAWFTASANAASGTHLRVAAENVVTMILTPRLARADEAAVANGKAGDHSPLAPDYLYDSAPTGAAHADGRVNPVHQLPPLLHVTLVAIDEKSAQRLGLGEKADDPFLLERNARFTRSADYSKDLLHEGDDDSLENQLIRRGSSYRLFSTNVIIRGAKWSRETTN